MEAILTAKNVKFQEIIEYPFIEIKENVSTFISGESGAGKSTLLKLFNGTASPSEGVIEYKGKDISEMDTVELRRKVILVSQTVFLFDGTIEDNFNTYYSYRDLNPLPREEMIKYLSICCGDFPLDTRCETMSGGERQRIFIAICLSFKPEVLMLDEPTSALDQATANRFFNNIKSFCKEEGITLVVISHDRGLAEEFGEEHVLLERKV